jgi:hypothetical protein
MGMVMVMLAIALGAWALGRMQTDNNGAGFGAGPGASNPPPTGSGPTPTGTGPPPPSQNGYAAGGSRFGGAPPPNTHGYQGNTGPPPGYTHSGFNQSAPPPGAEPPKPTWQRSNPTAGSSGAESSAKSAWERARQETKKREEERKKTEAEKKQREENERKLKEAREREAKERELREKLQREARERAEKELRAKIEREAREKIEREAREKLEREKKATSPEKPKGSTYAFSSMGERTNPWPNGGPPGSPDSKRPQAATARPYQANDEAYSARPYDKAKNPTHKKSHSSLYSESSYAASQTTAQTTPPPSRRGPYTTKDPDKIVVKAVYSFASAFGKTPTSQLVSGVGSVTDGLILRVTTEGLFIDDDVRGVPQREWDVKAWTLKLVEVRPFLLFSSALRTFPLRNSFQSNANLNRPATSRKTSLTTSTSCAPISVTRRVNATCLCSQMRKRGRSRSDLSACGRAVR